MARKKGARRQRPISDQRRHLLRADLLSFIELRPFTERWKELKLGDEDLFALQALLMVSPSGFPLVPGTGGLRKIRFAPLRWWKGKRGAVRVGYVHFPAYGIVLLVIAYRKGEKDDLTPAEKKRTRDLIRQIEREFAARFIRP